ncbi:MAG: ATP-dependent RecD-like DNA helicase [Eubacterium sp.]|nr:ATP-dependent RecD-like DNA helicase [Eubacterium sp.]
MRKREGITALEIITGYVDHIVYHNADNGYTVFSFVSSGTAEDRQANLTEEDEITCTGIFSVIAAGENYELHGEYNVHPTYGPQFKVSEAVNKAPEDLFSMERYLGSGAIKGVGTSLAARIVRRFKEDTFRMIEEEPERLAEIKGISERKAMEIAGQVTEKKELRSAMLYLQKYGISLSLAVKIYQAYGMEVYRILQENPYRMADDIPGVGFKIADEIAAKVGIHTDSDFRIRSGILYVLLKAGNEGHTFLPEEELTRRCADLLEVEAESVEKHYMDLAIERKLFLKEQPLPDGEKRLQIYPASFYYMELNTAAMLRELNMWEDVPEIEIKEQIRKLEKNSGIELDEKQAKAVLQAAVNGVLVITGGPGTGKTTTINTIISYFELHGKDIMLAAPTGRAAKRMSEMTGFEAKTIHRLLEVNGAAEENNRFERNEENPLETDVLIVDEMSMVDISLMHSLLKAVIPGTKLILVGDVNQLPSVGPGCVLKDIIRSGYFPVVTLDKIFRQASSSDIIVNAHKINQGQMPVLDNKSRDFFFLKRQDADVIISVAIQLIRQKLPKYVEAKPYDIQVLTPMRKGLLGAERINKILQQYLNPPQPDKAEHETSGGLFREGDKVMQIKNNYQLEWEIKSRYGLAIDRGMGVYNGDMGVVKEINSYAERMTVEFDEGRQVEYPLKQLEELELAYAITIHKSQGSEYPAVIIPLLAGPYVLMNRNLLYTAVTRARKCVTLVGDDSTFFKMIENTTESKRYSGLKQRITELMETE